MSGQSRRSRLRVRSRAGSSTASGDARRRLRQHHRIDLVVLLAWPPSADSEADVARPRGHSAADRTGNVGLSAALPDVVLGRWWRPQSAPGKLTPSHRKHSSRVTAIWDLPNPPSVSRLVTAAKQASALTTFQAHDEGTGQCSRSPVPSSCADCSITPRRFLAQLSPAGAAVTFEAIPQRAARDRPARVHGSSSTTTSHVGFLSEATQTFDDA